MEMEMEMEMEMGDGDGDGDGDGRWRTRMSINTSINMKTRMGKMMGMRIKSEETNLERKREQWVPPKDGR
jgi:hypothetical protein